MHVSLQRAIRAPPPDTNRHAGTYILRPLYHTDKHLAGSYNPAGTDAAPAGTDHARTTYTGAHHALSSYRPSTHYAAESARLTTN